MKIKPHGINPEMAPTLLGRAVLYDTGKGYRQTPERRKKMNARKGVGIDRVSDQDIALALAWVRDEVTPSALLYAWRCSHGLGMPYIKVAFALKKYLQKDEP
jgi:hypothetical protein